MSCFRWSMGEISSHGIECLPASSVARSVTHVPGLFCYPCPWTAPTNLPTHQFTNSPIHQLTNSPILLEGVPEAEHHHVDVRPCRRKNRRRLERRRDEVPAGRLQVIGEAALSVRSRAGQDLTVYQTLADAEVVVQQVTEVGDVQTNLPRVTPPGDAVEDVLGQVQVDRVDHRQEEGAPFRILTAVRAQIAVRLNELLERSGLI